MSRSRWGGYKRGRSYISAGKTVRSGTPTVPTSLDYRNAAGIWNMKSTLQFPKVQKLQMVLQSSSFLGSAATVTTYSCPVPTAARVGDVAIAFFVLNGSTATMSTPTGWTLATSSATYPRIYSFFKTLVAGDLNTTISGTSAVAAGYSSGMMTFNGSGNSPATADAFTYNTAGGTTNSGGGSSSVTVGSSAGTGSAVIAVGCACGNPTTQVNTVTLTNQTASIACDATTGMSAGNITLVYSIFNPGTTPLDLTVATNDAGSQATGGYYLNCTIGT